MTVIKWLVVGGLTVTMVQCCLCSDSIPDARTTRLKINPGAGGRIAILRDDFEPEPGHADPEVLASTLSKAGYDATLIKSGGLADPAVLNVLSFDCVILPYGPDYPYAALESIKSYLKSGGSFLSTGGYAFDRPCASSDAGGMVPIDVTITAQESQARKRLNTRHGKPGDTLGLESDQIGIFDPSYHLKYASALRAAPMQFVVSGSFELNADVEGYAACSMLGNNNPVFAERWGRHIPLVNACDSFGRERGPVGTLVHNYAGPYAGSSWAFFGVANTNLFDKSGRLLAHLPAMIDALVGKTFLHSLETDLACYKEGEPVRMACRVANLGDRKASARVIFKVREREGSLVFSLDPINVSLEAGQTVLQLVAGCNAFA